jgi:hypothetical protein
MDGLWQLNPLSANLLRLGRWRLTLGGGAGSTSRASVVEPAPIVNQLGRSSLAFVPRISERFGLGTEIGMPEIKASYETSFQCDGAADLSVVMQDGALEGRWVVRFDGSGPFGPQDFSARPGPLEDCVGTDVPCPGRASTTGRHVHHVTVDAVLSGPDQGLRDSIYVAGAFSVFAPSGAGTVHRSGATGTARAVEVPVVGALGAPRAEAEIGAWEAAGLPYYAGLVDYTRSVGAVATGNEGDVVVELQLPPGFEEAAEVAFGDGPLRPVPWSPRRALVPGLELAGEHVQVRVRVATSLARAFEGRWFDPSSHSYRQVDLAVGPAAP